MGGITHEQWHQRVADLQAEVEQLKVQLVEAQAEVAACDGHAYLRDEITRLESQIEDLRRNSITGWAKVAKEQQARAEAAEAQLATLRGAAEEAGEALSDAASLRNLGFNECFTSDGRTDSTGTSEATYAAAADKVEDRIGAARVRLRAALAVPTQPDKNCISLPDGSCVGAWCMHDAPTQHAGEEMGHPRVDSPSIQGSCPSTLDGSWPRHPTVQDERRPQPPATAAPSGPDPWALPEADFVPEPPADEPTPSGEEE